MKNKKKLIPFLLLMSVLLLIACYVTIVQDRTISDDDQFGSTAINYNGLKIFVPKGGRGDYTITGSNEFLWEHGDSILLIKNYNVYWNNSFRGHASPGDSIVIDGDKIKISEQKKE